MLQSIRHLPRGSRPAVRPQTGQICTLAFSSLGTDEPQVQSCELPPFSVLFGAARYLFTILLLSASFFLLGRSLRLPPVADHELHAMSLYRYHAVFISDDRTMHNISRYISIINANIYGAFIPRMNTAEFPRRILELKIAFDTSAELH